MKTLSSIYTNIHFVHVQNMSVFVSDSPYESTLQCSDRVCKLLEESMHPDYHYSDVMRALVAYKFGGIYSDLDIVTLKRLPDELPENFMVADVSRRLGNCFFKF